MTARDTYNASVKSAEANFQFGGDAGQSTGTLIPNNAQQFASLSAVEAAFANGAITAAQRVYLKQQSAMNTQVKQQTAKDVLRASGDLGPF